MDISVGGLLGGCIFGHELYPLSAGLRKCDVKRYWLWKTRHERLSPRFMALVFGERTGQELEALALDPLENRIAAAPDGRGFQIFQYVYLRNTQHRCYNIAQLAKLPFVDIYHPIADDEVVQAAQQLPANQMIVQRAYRRAMATYFPDLAAIPWTFTLTPATVSVPGVVLKKVAQLTLGQWLRSTSLGNHPLIRPRRYFANHVLWTRGPLRQFIEETLLSPEANATGLFDPDGLRAVIHAHMEGRQEFTWFLGGALALALWTRLFYLPSTPVRPSSLDSGNWKRFSAAV